MMAETETAVLEVVGHVITSIKAAKHVDQVISAIHSVAALLFAVDSHSLLGCINENFKDSVMSVKALSEEDRNEWRRIFYKGAAFPVLARVLLFDVASDWLACFPISARKIVYDVFFVNGYSTEVVQAIVPCLQHKGTATYDVSAISLNAERLIILSLLENDGVFKMVKELTISFQNKELADHQLKQAISRLAQLVTSIPDKARQGACISLSSHLFFKRITTQLLAGTEELEKNLSDSESSFNKIFVDCAILFIGETFARICRRGSSDLLSSEVIPRVLSHVRGYLSAYTDMTNNQPFELKPGFYFLSKMMDAIKDTYAVERMSEQLLHQLATQNVDDVEAYWLMWTLFHQIYEHQSVIRSMFLEKFLLWKVFPIRCLRWILYFAILECSPDKALQIKGYNARCLTETVQRLVAVWSKQEFVQSARLEQQAYVTAALGICLQRMSKEDLDATRDAIHSILQGVSCRLETPDHLIRKMASSIALVFSKIVDPHNPLYLDDSCHEETIDWEFGLAISDTTTTAILCSKDEDIDKLKDGSNVVSAKESDVADDVGKGYTIRGRKKKLFEVKIVDPDEIIDPATLNAELVSDNEDDDLASVDSETSSDSSLQPYDLTDDDTHLTRKFTQLVDVVGALRKSDDADGVERAINAAEKLVRASPDELKYLAHDMVRTLVQVRCSDFTVEGEEESAEEKRQKALVALIVTSPHESLETLHQLLYSPTIDISQRIMILDIMTDAAQDLANTRMLNPEHRPRTTLIASLSDSAWFVPGNISPQGSTSWKEISTPGTPLNLSYAYERELPLKPGHIKRGKTRRWSFRSSLKENNLEPSHNEFPKYAAAFMLPAMQAFDKKRHGVDLLGRDFIVLGKLIFMLGVCIKCAATHPEASVLASPLIDMLRSREVANHPEAYVRKSVLFAASCILVALHPSYVVTALVGGNSEIPKGLEWIRTWAHHVAESDNDRDCYRLAMTCLQLHSELAMHASRALESTEAIVGAQRIGFPSHLSKGIIRIRTEM